MIQAIIHSLLKRRHFWRYATFSEIAELYASRTIRIFALRLVAMFISVYLYQEGYSLMFLAIFWAAFFAIKVPFYFPAGLIAARIGPKHGILISNLISAFSMTLLPYVPQFGILPLAAWCVLQGFSNSLYDLCYMIDFSKVKNIEHAGKEIGYMNILEKIATSASPIAGGALALWFGPETVMVVSAVLFLLAALPLFQTGEQVRTHQKLEFRAFPWRSTWRGLVANTAIGFDVFASGTVWTLFMVVIVFAGSGNDVYVKVGAVSSVALIAALLASYAFGKIIDRRQGRSLLRASVVFNSFVHVFRPFIGSPVGIVAANITNEAATTGYSMAFTRGMFDTADMSGRRIVYLMFMGMVLNLGTACGALLLALILMSFDGDIALKLFFFVTSFVTLLIGIPAFKLYRK
jgi:MFS family permease